MANTALADLINPEVMADMVSAELPKKLRARDYMKVDTTLTARAGNTVTIPSYVYVGEADDLAEGAEGTPVKMEVEDVEYTVKKAAKFIQITDEAVLSGYGDPVGEATKQLRMSIEDKIDSDALTVLDALPAAIEYTAPGTLDFDAVCKAADKFDNDEPGETMTLLVSSAGLTELRKDGRFNDGGALADQLTQTGTVGIIGGCKVVKWKKLPDNVAYILKSETLTAFIKRDVQVESERKTTIKSTIISADEHYTVAIENQSKAVRVKYTPAA